MSLDIQGTFDAITSHAKKLGVFKRVNGHEPKNAPGLGVTAAVWVARIFPVPGASGLASTTGCLVFTVQLYTSMTTEPQDGIDPAIVHATDLLLAEYSGDFELGGKVRNVDLLGQSGVALSAQAGYLDIDKKIFRSMEITLPLIINDLWDQVA